MSSRSLVAAAVLLLLAAAFGIMFGMTWREDAAAVPAGSSAEGSNRDHGAGPTPHPGPALVSAGTAVAPTPGNAEERAAASVGAEKKSADEHEHEHENERERGAPGEPAAAGRGGPAPAVTRYTSDVQGLQSAMQSLVPELRECYAGWQKLEPGLGGAMQVRMTIEPDSKTPGQARVTRAEIANDKLRHAAVAGCVLNALQELSFEPPADGKLEVTYPLKFAGAGGGEASAKKVVP